MSDHTTVIIDWRGPFTFEEIEKNPEWRNGVYLLSGKRRYKHIKQIQYCGITEGSFASRFAQHHKLPEINRDLRIWLGEVSYPKNATRHFLEMAESIIVYFWQPVLNDRKKVRPPKPVTVLSRWLTPKGKPRMRQHPMCKDLEDVLSWDGSLWRTANLTVWEE